MAYVVGCIHWSSRFLYVGRQSRGVFYVFKQTNYVLIPVVKSKTRTKRFRQNQS